MSRFRDYFWPLAGSTLAGFLGAGVLDVLVTTARAEAPAGAGALLTMALGLYGAGGVIAGALFATLVSATLVRIPGGLAGLRNDAARDRSAAASILAAMIGVVVLAAGTAVGQRTFVGTMQSQKLAAIAAGGIVLILAPLAAALAIAASGITQAIARHLPRPARLGTTVSLLLTLGGLGVLGGIVALSRADWRVLDLGWLASLGAALALGTAHGGFWYRSAVGKRLIARWRRGVATIAVALLAIVLAQLAARLPEASPAYRAAADGSLGLRMALRIARAATDHDGDGYSGRFAGGDCDDRRADVYPGAEDIPGDGLDQNCEGGDAQPLTAEPATAGVAARPTTVGGPGVARNLLLVTIDATRADRLGVAGYGRPQGRSLTPNLDALAKRATYFRRVWSQAPNTPRSFPSLLTSRYPSDIDWKDKTANYSNLLPSNHTFFEGLAAAGIKPMGVFSHFYFTADRGLSRGFVDWTNDGAGTIAESNKDIAAPRIVPRAIERLRRASKANDRFALWVHLFEPHSSYMPHPEFPLHESGVPGLMEKYDYEIAYADIWVGKLLQALADLGLDKTTAVVVMADHGEAFGEHKVYFHGQDLFEEQLRVPLLIALPGKPPTVVDDPVMLVDLGPTVLDMLGQGATAGMRGVSLLPRILGQALPSRPVFSELLPATAWPHHAVMMIEGDRKLIHRVSDRRWELYDLKADPKEKRNLAADPAQHASFEAMRARLLEFEERRNR